MNEQEEVSIRRVTKDDYSKVMDMFAPGEIYNGRDYLPDKFHMLIDMPNVEAYAAAIGDQFVSFVLFTVVDDGKTVVSRAGRTRKRYEGRGFSSIIFECFVKTSQQLQSFAYEVKTSSGATQEIKKKLTDRQRTKIMQRNVGSYIASNIKDVTRRLQSTIDTKCSINLINEAELGELLSNQRLCNTLFSEGCLLVDFVPYKAVKSNYMLMKAERTTVVTSNLHDPRSALLTFLNYYRAVIGLVCVFDVYGNTDSNLKEHLLLHFKYIPTDKCDEKVLVFFLCNENTNWNFISDLMNSLGLSEYQMTNTFYICTEQKIKETSKL